MISSRQRKSSRARMQARNHRKTRKTPVVIQMKDGGEYDANRAAKRQRASWIAHLGGQSAAQENREKRKANQAAARRGLRKMRKETKKAMARAAGL